LSEIYSRPVYTLEDEFIQVKLVVNEFNGVEYLHLRKYYLDFNEEWQPTKEGISIPLTIENIKELFIGVAEIMSLAESKDILKRYFGELINTIYTR